MGYRDLRDIVGSAGSGLCGIYRSAANSLPFTADRRIGRPGPKAHRQLRHGQCWRRSQATRGAPPDHLPDLPKSTCSMIATARRRHRAISCAVNAFCQLLLMILCRSASRSASCG